MEKSKQKMVRKKLSFVQRCQGQRSQSELTCTVSSNKSSHLSKIIFENCYSGSQECGVTMKYIPCLFFVYSKIALSSKSLLYQTKSLLRSFPPYRSKLTLQGLLILFENVWNWVADSCKIFAPNQRKVTPTVV